MALIILQIVLLCWLCGELLRLHKVIKRIKSSPSPPLPSFVRRGIRVDLAVRDARGYVGGMTTFEIGPDPYTAPGYLYALQNPTIVPIHTAIQVVDCLLHMPELGQTWKKVLYIPYKVAMGTNLSLKWDSHVLHIMIDREEALVGNSDDMVIQPLEIEEP